MKILQGLFAGILAFMTNSAALTQDTGFPNRTIKIVVPFSPGASDAQIRVLAPILQANLGQPVIIENVGGAGGAIAANRVRTSPPDGYTLLFTGAAALTLLPTLRNDTNYTLDDFAPIANLSEVIGVAVVPKNAPYKTMVELVEFAKANPGKINLGSAGFGTASHVFAVGPQVVGNFRLTHIPFKGTADVLTAILSGNIDLGLAIPGLVVPYVQAGSMRAIAVTSAERSEYLPDVPTYKESGLNYVDGEWYGIVGPKDLPVAVVQRLANAFRDAVKAPEFQTIMKTSLTTMRYLPPAEYRSFLKDRLQQWQRYFADPTFVEVMKQ